DSDLTTLGKDLIRTGFDGDPYLTTLGVDSDLTGLGIDSDRSGCGRIVGLGVFLLPVICSSAFSIIGFILVCQ
ncbi:MAG: hypothetical protein ACYTX0_61305, partial [Nostoc sp.]